MSIVNLETISKAYGEKVILDRISASVGERDRIGIVGVNGAGKSTLLAAVADGTVPDSGERIVRNGLRISYLPQSVSFDETKTVLENVAEKITGKADHWDTEGEARALLIRFGIQDPSVRMSVLSGGQKKRAALIAALLTPCDLLILDEPTNHLDHEMIQWLEAWLSAYRGALLMVTHDRYFLDDVTEKIWELDRGSLFVYEENYSGYLEKKQQRLNDALASERKMAALYRQDLAWIQRGARARSTKQKAHIRRFEELRDREKLKEERNAEISSMSSRLGKKIIEIRDLSKSFGEKKLLENFSYIFTGTDRIGIIGKNGSGKSTLLKMITRMTEPDSGSIEVGQTVRFGYFRQENEDLPSSERVIDCIRDVAEYIHTKEGLVSASAMCERFLFDKKMQYTEISRLSGGEKRRLYLLKVLMSSPNVLILDEPTNDLDIQTLQVLEDYLDHFNGVILAVSHDRYFLDRVVTRIFSLEGDGKVFRSEGAYTEYLEHRERESENGAAPGIPSGRKEKPSDQNPDGKDLSEKKKDASGENRHSSRKLSYREQREYDGLEEEIESLTQQSEELDRRMAEASTDFVKLSAYAEEKRTVEETLEQKMERFFELQEKIELFAR